MSEYGHAVIYPQRHYHGEAFMVATTDGLRHLRDTIDRLLEGEDCIDVALLYAPDGEGYSLVVEQVSKGDFWRKPCAYTADYASGGPRAYFPTDAAYRRAMEKQRELQGGDQ